LRQQGQKTGKPVHLPTVGVLPGQQCGANPPPTKMNG